MSYLGMGFRCIGTASGYLKSMKCRGKSSIVITNYNRRQNRVVVRQLFERLEAENERSGAVTLAANARKLDMTKVRQLCNVPSYVAPQCNKNLKTHSSR